MNFAEKMEIETRLLSNLASWMEVRGEVIFDKSQSNAYTGVRIREIRWKESLYRIVDVDGITCEIKKIDRE